MKSRTTFGVPHGGVEHGHAFLARGLELAHIIESRAGEEGKVNSEASKPVAWGSATRARCKGEKHFLYFPAGPAFALKSIHKNSAKTGFCNI